MIRETEFKRWCEGIRARFEEEFNEKPSATPNLVSLTSTIQERIMRCAVEARYFGISDSQDELAILAHHTLLKDDLHFKGGRRLNYLDGLYGVREKKGMVA